MAGSKKDGLYLTVEDVVDKTITKKHLPLGEFAVIAVEPCHVERIQSYRNGTFVLTIKGHIRRPAAKGRD